jgi:hypothetical protein
MANRKQWLLTAIILLCTVAGYFLRSPAYSLGWHAIHGDSTKCGDLKIKIPRGWWAAADQKGVGVLLTRWPQYTFGNQKDIQLGFHLNRNAPSPNSEQWRQDVSKRLTAEGYVLGANNPTRVAGQDAFCIESHQIANDLADHISCNVDQTMIVHFTYDGDPTLKAEFYRILSNISKVLD